MKFQILSLFLCNNLNLKNMSLRLNFSCNAVTNGKFLIFRETTGEYNEVSNPTGWSAETEDSPINPKLSEVTGAYIEITPIDTDVVTTIDLFTKRFPNASRIPTVSISMEDLGGTNLISFPDGTYKIRYVVIANNTTYDFQRYIYCYSQIRSCVSKMFAKIKVSKDCIGCTEEEIAYNRKALDAYTYYKALLCAALTGQLDKASLLLTHVRGLCTDNRNCINCNN